MTRKAALVLLASALAVALAIWLANAGERRSASVGKPSEVEVEVERPTARLDADPSPPPETEEHAVPSAREIAEPAAVGAPNTGTARLRVFDAAGRQVVPTATSLMFPAGKTLQLHRGPVHTSQHDGTLRMDRVPFDQTLTVSFRASWVEDLSEGDELFFDFFGPDSSLTAQVNGPGPTAANREVFLDIHVDAIPVEVTGRAVDAAGVPLDADRVQIDTKRWHVSRRTNGGSWSARLDDEGRFRIRMWFDPTEEIETRTLALREGERRSLPCDLPLEAPAPPVDLGDVRCVLPPVIAAGRVVDLDGAPVEQAYVKLRVERERGQWRETGATARVDEEGEFVLRGYDPPERISLRADARGYLAERTEPFRTGETGLVIALASSSTLTGRLLLDEGIDATELGLRFLPAGGGEKAARPDPAGEFRFGQLPSGPGALAVRVAKGELARLENVAPGSGDPRLDPIDLRGLLVGAMIEVEDEGGDAVEGAGLHREGDTLVARGSRMEIVLPLDFRGRIEAPGFAASPFEHPARHQVVVLREGHRVTLRLPALAPAEREDEERAVVLVLGDPMVVAEDGSRRLAPNHREVFAAPPGGGELDLRLIRSGRYSVSLGFLEDGRLGRWHTSPLAWFDAPSEGVVDLTEALAGK